MPLNLSAHYLLLHLPDQGQIKGTKELSYLSLHTQLGAIETFNENIFRWKIYFSRINNSLLWYSGACLIMLH